MNSSFLNLSPQLTGQTFWRARCGPDDTLALQRS